MTAKVKYQIATYSGIVHVNCDDDEDRETIIARAKATLRREAGPLPYGYESWEVEEHTYDH